MHMSSKEAGFTLVETLIAVFSLGLLMSAGGALVLSILDSQRLVDQRLERLEALELTSAYLQTDLANAVPRLVESEFSVLGPQSFYGGRPDRIGTVLGFVRDGWDNREQAEDRSELLSVRYRFDQGTFTRQVDLRPDRLRATPRAQQVLLEGVTDIQLQFIAAGQSATNWTLVVQDGAPRLPDAVEMTIVFEGGQQLSQSFLVGGRQ